MRRKAGKSGTTIVDLLYCTGCGVLGLAALWYAVRAAPPAIDILQRSDLAFFPEYLIMVAVGILGCGLLAASLYFSAMTILRWCKPK